MMEFKDIQQLWASQPAAGSDPGGRDDVVARVRTLNRRVFVRDSIELVVAIGMAAVFLWIATLAPVMWPWMAAAVVVLGVGGVFVRERMQAARRAADPGDVRRGLERAIEEADHQIRLLSTVAVWYLAPLLAAVVLILVGTVLGARAEMGPDVWARARAGIIAAAVVALPVVGAVFAGVWWLNRRAVIAHLQPHRAYLVDALRQLTDRAEAGEMSDGR